MSEPFFVGIYDPVDVRRNILECSKETVKTMQGSQRLKDLREQKVKAYHEMKAVMKEIDILVNRLEEKLPPAHLRTYKPVQLTAQSTTPKKTYTSNLKFAMELEKLGQELRSVERELLSMSNKG